MVLHGQQAKPLYLLEVLLKHTHMHSYVLTPEGIIIMSFSVGYSFVFGYISGTMFRVVSELSLPHCLFQASTFPTVVVYVMDIIRSVNPVTFMSNMLYACR